MLRIDKIRLIWADRVIPVMMTVRSVNRYVIRNHNVCGEIIFVWNVCVIFSQDTVRSVHDHLIHNALTPSFRQIRRKGFSKYEVKIRYNRKFTFSNLIITHYSHYHSYSLVFRVWTMKFVTMNCTNKTRNFENRIRDLTKMLLDGYSSS